MESTDTLHPQRRNTRQRQLVLDAVRAHNDHPTADDIYSDVRERDSKISRGTVYRNLKLLEEDGLVRSIATASSARFDWRTHGHAHVTCRVCGRVDDVMVPAYDAAADELAAKETGFSGLTHSTMFEGICPTCAVRQK